jgi:hypothetical protein
MRPRHALLVAGILVPPAALLSANVGTGAIGSDPNPVLRQQLRNLVTAQEKYWADHGTYTTDVAALGFFRPRVTAPDTVWIQVVQAGGRSWWGRAVHLAQRGKSCIIYVGTMEDFTAPPTTDAAKVRAQREGDPICDPL